MFKILVDTCVWLDLVKDPQQQAILGVLEELVKLNKVTLIVPQTVVTEFGRHKDRVAKESCQSLSSVFKRVKEAVNKFGDPKKRLKVLEQLNDLDHRIPLLGEAASESISRIDKLLKSSNILVPTDDIKLRAANRAIEKKAPFHRQRNGIEDAIIFETYVDCVRFGNSRERFAFVTHNTKDFSDPVGDDRKPHPNIAPLFSKIKCLYFVKLAEAIQRVEPALVSDLMLEQEWIEEPRRLSELVFAVGELIDKIVSASSRPFAGSV